MEVLPSNGTQKGPTSDLRSIGALKDACTRDQPLAPMKRPVPPVITTSPEPPIPLIPSICGWCSVHESGRYGFRRRFSRCAASCHDQRDVIRLLALAEGFNSVHDGLYQLRQRQLPVCLQEFNQARLSEFLAGAKK